MRTVTVAVGLENLAIQGTLIKISNEAEKDLKRSSCLHQLNHVLNKTQGYLWGFKESMGSQKVKHD